MLLVRLQKDLPAGKTPGLPDDWPVEVEEVPDDTPDPKDGRLLLKDAAALDAYKAPLQAAYDQWRQGAELPGMKEEKCDAIDRRTVDLINEGYTYGGKQLSLSAMAQVTLLGLDAVRNEPTFKFPVVLNALNNDDTYSVVDAADAHDIFLTAVATYRQHKDDGTKLKDAVRAATTADEVNAVEDAR